MSEPFIAEIRIFAGNFAIRGWAFCNGQLLPIAQNTALFSLIGTTYGGDGRTTTALPNLQGRAPMHPGRGPGLTARRLGQRGGIEEITLSEDQTPAHSHTFNAKTLPGARAPGQDNPSGNMYATSKNMRSYSTSSDGNTFNTGVLSTTDGGGESHENMQPFLTLNYIIALQGAYPSRD